MDAPERFYDTADLPDAMPERWETAIEDLAQAVAVGLDRAQDLADAINDVVRTRPVLAKAVGAAVVGALIGTFLAARTMHRPKPALHAAREAAAEASSAAMGGASLAMEQAMAIARSTAERMAKRVPPREDIVNSASHMTDSVRSRFASEPASVTKKVGYAAQLVPLGIALLKNPLVRDLLVRAATKSAKRSR